MTEAQFIAVLQRAASDATFRELLFKNPNQALKDYDLTAEERKTLTGLTPETFETLKGQWIPGG
jgi:hypothetical protein